MKFHFFITLLLFNLYSSHGQFNAKIVLKQKLDSAFALHFSANEPGGSILIQQGKETLYQQSFGLADIKTKKPFTANTVSNLGSISKTFVAYGILLLQQERKLSVEDGILKYFPDFKNKELAAKIKIKHLLSHTSGLPDNRGVEKDSIFFLTAGDWDNFKPLLSNDTLEFDAGSAWNYSNPAYNGLALIIEKVSGIKWQDYIVKKIFKPSGMKNSKITDGAYPSSGVAHAYRKVNGVFEEYDYGEYPTFTATGNGGVWSSINELKKYVAAIEKKKFLNSTLTNEYKKPMWFTNWKMNRLPFHSGVWFVHPGISFRQNDGEKYEAIEHSGDQAGFKAHLIMIPEKQITIIWLTNNDKFMTNIIRKALLQSGYLN